MHIHIHIHIHIHTHAHTGLIVMADSLVDLEQEEKPLLSTKSVRTSLKFQKTLSVQDYNRLEEVDVAILQSVTFIEDAIKYRSIHHKIDPRTLKFYHFYYSRPVQWTVRIAILLVMILAFFEYPSSFSLSSDPRYRNSTRILREQPQCGVTESIEFLCLLIFFCDFLAKFHILGWRRFHQKPWLILYVILILLSIIDLVVALEFKCDVSNIGYTLRLRRFFRPAFLIVASTTMKKFMKAIQRTLPSIATVVFLLFLNIYVFAMIGLLIFPPPSPPSDPPTNSSGNSSSNVTAGIVSGIASDLANTSYYDHKEGEKYFGTIGRSIISLTVLVTTANHPNVMMPIYQYNRFSSLYFIVFVIIGTFVILNVLIATTYNHFKGFWVESMQHSFFRRVVAFRAAFTILAKHTQHTEYRSELVSKELIRATLQKAKIPRRQVPLLYSKFETVDSEYLKWSEFRQVFDLLSKDPSKRKQQSSRLLSSSSCLMQRLELAVRMPLFAYLTYLVCFINVVMITVELQLDAHRPIKDPMSRLAYYNFFFLLFYMAEQVVKIVGFGPRSYFKNLGNIFDFLIIVVFFAVEVVLVSTYSSPFVRQEHHLIPLQAFDTLVRLANILVVLRLLKVVFHFKSLSFLIGTVLDLVKNLRGFVGIMVIIYYLFALLGMELFLDTVDEKLNDNSSQVNVCGTFENSTFFANNFHDFASSLVVLWDTMIGNNWMVFLEAFARASGWWTHLYFIAWWLVSAVVCVNLFVSVVLDTFTVKWESKKRKEEQEKALRSSRVEESELMHELSQSSESQVSFQ